MAAALALANCGQHESLPALLNAIAKPSDSFLTHCLIYSISRLATTEDLQTALNHPSPRVQRAALILLDQLPRDRLKQSAVVERLGATDEALRRAALDALMRHPEWAQAALDLIDELLATEALSEDKSQTLRSLIIAFHNQPQVATDVGRSISGERDNVRAERRALLLSVLAETTSAEILVSWKDAIGKALDDSNPVVQFAAARAAVALDLQDYLPRLVELSTQEGIESALRLDLLRAIVRHQQPIEQRSIDWLLDRIADDDHPLDQLGATEVLARVELDSKNVSKLLELTRDRPLVSASIILPLLERSASGAAAASVVEFMRARVLAGWRPNEEDLNKVVSRLSPPHRAAGESLVKQLHDLREQQGRELAGLLTLAVNGDPTRGRSLFFAAHAACSTCHRVGPEGGNIGPDLTRIGVSRTPRDMIESIVVPASTIAQGFESYTVQTTDGLVFGGILARQTPELIVLVDSARNETRIPRIEIETMTRSTTSIMPDGFGSKLTPEQLADLVAWLQSLR